MTEPILLCLFAALTLLVILAVRKIVLSKRMLPLSKRWEAAIRYALTAILALVAHLIYGDYHHSYSFVSAVVFNSLVIYAVSHLADKIILKDKE